MSELKYYLVNLVVKNKIPLERWIIRDLVTLEKFLENINIEKLRAILLLEVDFNASCKIIYNNRLVPKLEAD